MSAYDPDGTAERLLAERIGLDAESLGAGAIARALQVRMTTLGLHDRAAYLRQLARSDLELQELVEEVVVPESWFFRDEHPFAALRSYVSARRDGAGSAAPGPPLRVLSIPCGCGEEPYSIAITLHDLELTPGRFQIDAVDVSARHLAAAERGVYRANSFRGMNLGFRDRYFHAAADAQDFTLNSSIRATVRFTRGNLLDPDLLRGRPAYDIIFCRNVLIYFDGASRLRALATLDRLLGRAGLLFVGHAERLAIDHPRLEPYGENADFVLRHAENGMGERARGDRAKGERDVARCAAPPTPILPRAEGGRKTPEGGGSEQEGGRKMPPVGLPESSATLIAEASALADGGQNDEAAARCETAAEPVWPKRSGVLPARASAAGRGPARGGRGRLQKDDLSRARPR